MECFVRTKFGRCRSRSRKSKRMVIWVILLCFLTNLID